MIDSNVASWRSAAVLLLMSAACVRSSESPSPPTTTATTAVAEPVRCVDAAADRREHSYIPPELSHYPVSFVRSPADVDGDEYDDHVDDCRHYPEDFDGFEDEDGCPDCDNDGDGVLDADVVDDDGIWVNLDRLGNDDCRNDAEDLDGDRDEDGCPDLPDVELEEEP